jgi:hypothetical protein
LGDAGDIAGMRHISRVIRGDYQQFDLDPQGRVVHVGDRMRAKLEAIRTLGLPPDFVAGKSVLDVGTDHGFWAFLSSTAGARSVLGLDRNRQVKGRSWPTDLVAQNTALARRFPLHSRVHFQKINLGAQWHEYGQFDVVLCMSVFHHIYAQCGDLASCWLWLARHASPGALLIWEGPVDGSDPVVAKDVPEWCRPGYHTMAISEAAQRYFKPVAWGHAMHEPTRQLWVMRRNDEPTGAVLTQYVMQAGTGGATKAFLREHGQRMVEIGDALGVVPCPGSLNLMLPEPFDWERDYYRVRLGDSTDRSNPDAPWDFRWCRFYPVAIDNVGGWAMRFEGEAYPNNFVEVIGPHRLRGLVADTIVRKPETPRC